MPLLVVLLAACAPDAVAWRVAAPALTVSDEELIFAAVPVGAAASLPLTLTNTGGAGGVWTLASGGPFALDRTEVDLGAGGSATVTVRFLPETWDDAAGELLVDGVARVRLVGPILADVDGDGHDTPLAGGDDCDDADAAVHPGAVDPCGDDVDADCSPEGDDDCDGDGVPTADDCDDTDAAVAPGATETGPDGRDEDCDGRVDEHLLTVGELVLTELSPQEPAWIELCNVSARAIEAGGLTIRTTGASVDLAAGALAPGGCAAVCASSIAGCAFTAPLTLDADADTVTVEMEGLALDAVTVDATWGWTPGWVWSLDAGATTPEGNDAASAWCRTAGSPGAPNGACG